MGDRVGRAAREDWRTDVLQRAQLLYLALLDPPRVQDRVHYWDRSVHLTLSILFLNFFNLALSK